MLLRLEHIFEENETNDELSQPVTFTLADNFFSTFVIIQDVKTLLLSRHYLQEFERIWLLASGLKRFFQVERTHNELSLFEKLYNN